VLLLEIGDVSTGLSVRLNAVTLDVVVRHQEGESAGEWISRVPEHMGEGNDSDPLFKYIWLPELISAGLLELPPGLAVI
jgi:hypothetical protein